MIHPTISEDGSNNWAEVDWDDLDIGVYTNLCPDKRRADFEYGSILIVDSAERGPAEKILEPQNLSPSKITRELDQIIGALDRLSLDARWHLNSMSKSTEPVEEIINFLQRGIDQPPADKTKGPDEVRNILAADAWAIWAHHGGDVKSDKFIQYVERLLESAGFLSELGKSRVNLDNLVRQICRAAKQNSPALWRLWD